MNDPGRPPQLPTAIMKAVPIARFSAPARLLMVHVLQPGKIGYSNTREKDAEVAERDIVCYVSSLDKEDGVRNGKKRLYANDEGHASGYSIREEGRRYSCDGSTFIRRRCEELWHCRFKSHVGHDLRHCELQAVVWYRVRHEHERLQVELPVLEHLPQDETHMFRDRRLIVLPH